MNASPITADFDTRRFNQMLDAYLYYSRKSFRNEINKRGFNICLKAIGKTPKVTAKKIESDMTRAAKVQPKSSRRGKRAPVAAILTNYHRGKKGKKGLWGKPMQTAVDRAIKHRQKGRGFMASGWLGAAADIGLYCRPPREVRSSSKKFQLGKAKGEGRPERRIGPLRPTASGRHGSDVSSNIKGARAALRYAVNAETRDMIQYIRRKMGKDWAVMNKINAAKVFANRKL